MTAAFWAVALTAVALAWGLLRAGHRLAGAGGLDGRVRLALFDEHAAALDADRASGALDAGRHREAMDELQRRLLVESESTSAPPTAGGPTAAASAAEIGAGATTAARSVVAPDADPAVARRAPSAARATPAATDDVAPPTTSRRRTDARRLFAALAIALPAFVVGGYLVLGNPAALHATPPVAAAATDAVSPDEMRQMIDLLAQRLQSRPAGQVEDLPGWVMLARSQAALQRFPEAAAAYERAVALAPADAQLLADLADVLTMVQAPGSADRAQALIDRSLAADPRNPKALALAGNAAFGRRDTAAAIDFWRRARAAAPPDSEFARGLDQTLAEAGAGDAPPAGLGIDNGAGAASADAAPAPGPGVDATGVGSPPAGSATAAASARTAAAEPAPAAAQRGATATIAATAAPATAAGRAITGEIRIAPELAARIGPGDTLFVFARAAEGPRMPLAILRRPAVPFEAAFRLDDAMAMSPTLTLSNFDAVVVGVRISRSGDAMPQPGDLIGEARADARSGRITVVVDRVQR